MKKSLIAGVVAVVFAGSVSAADAAVYNGHVRGAPGSTFEITVAKEDGKRTVTDMAWDGATRTCNGMSQPSSGSTNFTSGGRVRHGEFKAKLDAGIVQIRIKGELKQGGKAAGTFRDTYNFMGTSCDTGRLEWVAHR